MMHLEDLKIYMVKNMVYKILIFTFISIISLYGANEKKGQRYYIKNCSSCHGSGKRGGNLATMEDWENYFLNNAKELKTMHPKQKEVVEYLNSKKFNEKHKEKMLIFLKEFAKDSPTIPSCNN